MAKLFPFRPEGPDLDQRPRLVGLDDEGADEVFAALSSDTARTILERLYQDPATATDVAEAADTSLQNARYHIDKLVDAGLIEAVDTWYSSRGTEMTVYAPTNAPLVLAAGQDEQTSVLRKALGRLVGAIGVLGLASVLIDRIFSEVGPTTTYTTDVESFMGRGSGETETRVQESTQGATNDGDIETVATDRVAGATTPEPEALTTGGATETPHVAGTGNAPATTAPTDQTVEGTRVVQRAATETTSPAGPDTATAVDPGLVPDLAGALPPGAVFFAGGLAVLLILSAWWYWRHYRPLYVA